MNRTVFRSIAASYIPRLILFLTTPISFIVVTKSLSEESFGAYSLILTIANFCVFLFTFGLSKYLNYAVPGSELQTKYKVFFNITFIEFLGYILSVMVFLIPLKGFIAKLLNFHLNPNWIWAAPLLWGVYLIEQRILNFFGLKKRITLKVALGAIEQIIYVALLLIVFYYGVTIKRIIFSQVISFAVVIFISVRFFKMKYLTVERSIDKGIVFEALKYSLPLILVDASLKIMQSADRFIVSSFHTMKETGIYSYANGYIQWAYLIGSPLLWSLYPFFADAYRKNEKSKNELFYLQSSLTYVFAAGSASILIFDRNFIIPFISKPEYLASPFTYLIFLLYPIGIMAMYLYQQILMLEKDTKFIGKSYLYAALINVALNFILIPHFAGNGAALANVISFYFIGIMFFHRCRRYDIKLFGGWLIRFFGFWLAWSIYLYLSKGYVKSLTSLIILHTFTILPFLAVFKVIDFSYLFSMIRKKEQQDGVR